ncbi:hypothetical protein FB451DRAFT_1227279 [Mycena latifolia]|nr:hypothetical protein FB451DRAFT_1227279 [Mycena latifolia]
MLTGSGAIAGSTSPLFPSPSPHRAPRKIAMHLPVWVLALCLSFTTLAAAQSSSSDADASVSTSTVSSATVLASASATAPAVESGTTFTTSFGGEPPSVVTAFATAPASSTPSSMAVPVAAPASAGIERGPIVAAAVGGSIASCLVVLAGTLFCFYHRARPGRSHSVRSAVEAGTAEGEARRRCDALEGELRALRAQLARLEARVDASASAGGAVLYTNEKDPAALEKSADGAKESPPTYMD